MIAQKFIIAEQNRQIVLDLLNERGPMTAMEILAILGINKQTLHSRLVHMFDYGEVRRTGKRPVIFEAIKKTTTTHQDTVARSLSKHNQRPTPSDGRIIHRIADTPKKSYPAQTSKSRPRGCTYLESFA